MKVKKFTIYIILMIILFLAMFQLTSCTFIEGIKDILGGFQFGKPESTEIVSATENVPRSLEKEGNDILSVEKVGEKLWEIIVRKKGDNA